MSFSYTSVTASEETIEEQLRKFRKIHSPAGTLSNKINQKLGNFEFVYCLIQHKSEKYNFIILLWFSGFKTKYQLGGLVSDWMWLLRRI